MNPVDWKVREGRLSPRVPHGFPLIPGWDVAGVVDELGEGCQTFRKGDRVFAYARKPLVQWGTYAEYVAVAERHVALMPAEPALRGGGRDPLRRADGRTGPRARGAGGGRKAPRLERVRRGRALRPAAGEDRRRALHRDRRGIEPGIHDEPGGGKLDRHRARRSRGAVEARFPGGVDAVLDAIGGEPLASALSVVKPGGVIVSVVDTLDADAVKARGVRFERISTVPSGEQLAVFAAHAGRKKLRPHVRTIYPLASAAEAQEESRGGHVRGKLVLAL